MMMMMMIMIIIIIIIMMMMMMMMMIIIIIIIATITIIIIATTITTTIIIIIIIISCHRPFLPGTSLEPAVIPPLKLQASHCSTFRIMCDVPSTAVFCNESIECFPSIKV